ncbi:MAG: hypothetical protein F6K04_01165 [Leptolyngbya sp. SIO4C5]|nr:hypothetical protein [Leptolyngbya sp. SIO4C5]
MARPGHKSSRGVPEKYDQVKKPVSYSLTLTAKLKLSKLAEKFEPYTSEFLERLARGHYLILPVSAWKIVKAKLPKDLISLVEEFNERS